ncbi:ATP-binding protein [Kordiimonas sp.]|uniref:YobI family P-loop NTPase n=1 Tax=Kordiimonas sp. TaxID=1970157 RepID=UPI003B518DAE
MMISWIKSLLCPDTENSTHKLAQHTNLAPTDQADEHGVYRKALGDATNDENIFNIALTGPYGSGKSSIIRTFLKEYPQDKYLNISLAAFLPESEGRNKAAPPESDQPSGTENQPPGASLSTKEIERSILQQMFYGADANRLPLSRFKRIQSPKWKPWFTSLLLTVGLLSCWYSFETRADVLTDAFWQPEGLAGWSKVTGFVFGVLFIWQVLRYAYVKSLGLSLKSVSLKNLEIAPEAAKEESILNRHLDEIIYFFQSTEYDLVIIEDLDRFDNPDIFVTLREINCLINKNIGKDRTIRFLYALRDNMFVNTDRTKFFEYIIPVIPIINSSNSQDKVIEQVKRLSLREQPKPLFLRDVSRYLIDMRLIINIFTEYAVYIGNLDAKQGNDLKADKLLAVLIYKNVLPSDFENLHRQKGKFAEILKGRDKYITDTEKRYKDQIIDLEQKINDSKKQVSRNLQELREIYTMALIKSDPRGIGSVTWNGKQISTVALPDHEMFEEIFEMTNVPCSTFNNYGTTRNLRDIQEKVNSNETFQDRKALMPLKSQKEIEAANQKIRQLRKKISELRTTKFHELLQANVENMAGLFDQFGEHKELMRYLILEGYLDDTYYLYTSLPHSGRLSLNDIKYIRKIRGYSNPEPDYKIDNPKEVIEDMRPEDFGQAFVLNKALIDCMFGDQTEYQSQIEKFIKFVSSSFTECEEFFATYYESGKFNTEMMATLLDSWSGYCSALLSSPNNAKHIARLFAHLPEDQLEKLDQQNPEVAEFISTGLAEILSQGIEFEPTRLALLHFEAEDLNSIQIYPAVARVLYDEGLYEITPDNLEFIFEEVLASERLQDLKTKNYSTVLNSGEVALINKIEGNINEYARNVLLKIESNIDEEIDAFTKLINYDEIDLELLTRFIEKQTAKLPSLDQVPEHLHCPIFGYCKIDPTWENCMAYRQSKEFDKEILTDFLQHEGNLSVLSKARIDRVDSALPLWQFLFGNDEFSPDQYRAYIQQIPTTFSGFPSGVEKAKIRIVVEEKKVTFNPDNLSYLSGHEGLPVLFVAKNFEAYLEKTDQFELDDDFREELLKADISNEQKLKIIDEMDLSLLPSLGSRASIIGNIIHGTGAKVGGLKEDAAQAVIIHSKPIATQISLFNRYQNTLSVAQVRSTIDKLPHPFFKMKPGGGMPKIPNTDENREFVSWLESRSIISSSKVVELDRKIRIHNFKG